jgi:hypothetical protein
MKNSFLKMFSTSARRGPGGGGATGGGAIGGGATDGGATAGGITGSELTVSGFTSDVYTTGVDSGSGAIPTTGDTTPVSGFSGLYPPGTDAIIPLGVSTIPANLEGVVTPPVVAPATVAPPPPPPPPPATTTTTTTLPVNPPR